MTEIEEEKRDGEETQNPQEVILLPAGSITSTVVGESGIIYNSVLFDDPELGRPVHQILE